MALDRQTIEKKDFPVGRRGYDPDAVDAHLAALADEVTEFKLSSRRRADTLAASASDQVRAIVEAAESSAADIRRDAETEAREIRDEAKLDAAATREEASEHAHEYVGKISESAAAMLQRIDAMDSELAALIEALRTGGNRLDSDMRLLESNLSGLGDALKPRRPEFESQQPEQPEQPEHFETATDGWGAEVDGADRPDDDLYDPDAADGGAASTEAGAQETVGDDAEPVAGFGSGSPEAESAGSTEHAEGARLIALNMALNGTPRDETARYLSQNFELAESAALLDEVYASVEG